MFDLDTKVNVKDSAREVARGKQMPMQGARTAADTETGASACIVTCFNADIGTF